tara:strand:+ start:136 stop:357 length:222 start_codon:yes stop_codon:yes gene_type:complete
MKYPNLDTLVRIYTNWGDRKEQQNIAPLTSADEMLWHPGVTEKQELWLKRFIEVWNYAENPITDISFTFKKVK